MLKVEINQDVAIVRVDDGKANAVSEAFSAAVHEGLDRAEREAKAVVLAGRPGRFSAGFDLRVIEKGPEAAASMRDAGSRMLLRLFSHPQPVVIACTGHALAAGALILLCGDTRVGIRGDFKIGLNETAIGLTLPTFGLELARARIPAPYLTAAVIQAQLYNPEQAVDVGYLDQVVEPEVLLDTALEAAQRLAVLPGETYGATKRALRAASIETIRQSLDAD